MNKDAKFEVSQNFESFLSKGDVLNFCTVLIHRDFGASNI